MATAIQSIWSGFEIFIPDMKGPLGGLIIGSSVCLSACFLVRNSIPLTYKVQYLMFGWSYNNQLGLAVNLRVDKTLLTSHVPAGWDRGQKVGLRDFDRF